MDFSSETSSGSAGSSHRRRSPSAHPQAWEDARCPTELLREMGELGLLGMLIPEEWGGIGMSTVGFVAAMEQLGVADQSVAAAWQAHVTIGSLPLFLFGIPLLKRGIRINAILPGPTDTPLAQANKEQWLGFGSDYRART